MYAQEQRVLPVGAYLTDGDVLVEILESDILGCLGEDVVTHLFVSIEQRDLDKGWRRVVPLTSAEMSESAL